MDDFNSNGFEPSAEEYTAQPETDTVIGETDGTVTGNAEAAAEQTADEAQFTEQFSAPQPQAADGNYAPREAFGENHARPENKNPYSAHGPQQQNGARYGTRPAGNMNRSYTPYGTRPAADSSVWDDPRRSQNYAPYGTNAGYSQYAGTGYGANPGGYTGPRTDAYRTDPYGARPEERAPYGETEKNYAPSAGAAEKPVKGKKITGKSIFAVLVCICIVLASIGIGLAISGKNDTSDIKPKTENSEATTQSGAVPEVEKTPAAQVPAEEKSEKTTGILSAEQVYEKVKDINVGVIVYSNTQKVGEGSGIIVGADDSGTYTYIITCAHVISQANSNAQVLFNDDTEVDADIVGFDTKTDVGVLRVKKTGFAAAKFGDSADLKVGSPVYAIGNPGGSEFFGTFTDGRITALDRPVATSSNSYYDLPCIQHNAAINPGNSGGALVNAYGQVIGLNSSKIADTEYEGMGFSVPINTVLEIYKKIVVHGYVTDRPKLGITYYAVSSDYTYSAIAWKNNLPYGSIVIASISPDSDLAGKNIREGDIIIAVNGKQLDSTDVLLEEIENGKVGDALKLTVCRLTSSGTVESKFDVNVKLVEDKGTNTVEQTEPATDDFSNFFPFGY